MILEDLLVVSFDGLNRAGKGTQIGLLREFLESNNYFVEVLRGDGSRPGQDSSGFYDPFSPFWQHWQGIKNKSLADWDYAAQVLAHENYLRCVEIVTQVRTNGVPSAVLLDRSHLSRWYMLRKEDAFAPFESCLKEHTVHPKIYFALDAPKEVLLARDSEDDPKKAEFRKRNVLQGYGVWMDTMNLVEARLPIHRLDGTEGRHCIHDKVKQIVSTEIYS